MANEQDPNRITCSPFCTKQSGRAVPAIWSASICPWGRLYMNPATGSVTFTSPLHRSSRCSTSWKMVPPLRLRSSVTKGSSVLHFMGGETTPNRAVVQSAGEAYRLDARIRKEEGPVQRLLLRYTQALITQRAQTAVCNRHHSIDQQLCRWLLFSIDRLPSNELRMTQELIANMLGVRRFGVTQAALDAG